ncbi:alpha/beta fold hydrolase [Paractinoplanes abujensis]|uniref:Pimeloyl-ACP methyl ester carboxylesterase n=1 Tax=Paractinoplanes abujensis TaxID=882441 RepID=A0A7W7CPA8_9ACTN|nr:alpha/beta fold hydrolase [Actinoplanes abujensis]MBB4692206.1 pimeloyl-ACP methyl ester carboxylesterase [Actinoplanes abujensis]
METRFARTADGVTIGYQVLGRGPALIWMPSLSNVTAQWRIPALRAAYLALARECTLVLYDGRGTGTSSRDIDLGDLGVEAHLRDLIAVLDATGLRRATLLGYYHSVATAIACAATQPRRVDRLVLYGGAARMSEAMQPAQTRALLSLVDQDWSLFADAAATAWLGWDGTESGRWTAEAFRTATTPAIAKAWFSAARDIDVTPLLPEIEAPTLVVHRQGDQQIPVEVFRRLTTAIPGARLVELPGSTPTLFVEDPAADLSLITGFATDGRISRTAVTGALTRREREVLHRLAAGDTNAEIGDQLGIAVHTVERHLANIYRKLGVRGRTAAVAYALRGV